MKEKQTKKKRKMSVNEPVMPEHDRQKLDVANFLLYYTMDANKNIQQPWKIFHYDIEKDDVTFMQQIAIIAQIKKPFKVTVQKDNKELVYDSKKLHRYRKPLKATFGTLEDQDKDRGFLAKITIDD